MKKVIKSHGLRIQTGTFFHWHRTAGRKLVLSDAAFICLTANFGFARKVAIFFIMPRRSLCAHDDKILQSGSCFAHKTAPGQVWVEILQWPA